MRSIVGIFGAVCGMIAVAIVGRYGYMSADTEIDGFITAFLFGAIAAGGLGGHAVAVRVWRHNRLWAFIIGLVCILALFVNLSNSLGFIAGRGDKAEAERSKLSDTVASDRTELARLRKKRDEIPAFAITTATSVRAAEAAVASAERIRKAECDKRGPRCRDRELAEQASREKLVEITAAKATTDRAARLDEEIAATRTKLAKSKPVEPVNPHAEALKRIFQLPENAAAYAATYQQFAVAAIVELLIVMSFVAFELIGREAHVAPGEIEAKGLSIEPPKGSSPKLVSSNAASMGSVPDIMADILEPARGERVEIESTYRAYAAACEDRGLRAVTPDQFIELMQKFCRSCRIRADASADHIFLIGVKITRETSHENRVLQSL